jgi:ribosomal protection tetracycline resistance protein
MQEIKQHLTTNCLLLQHVNNQGQKHANFENLWLNTKPATNIIEHIIEHDEQLMEQYLDEEPTEANKLEQLFKNSIAQFNIIPVIMGIAKNGMGIKELMVIISDYLPTATGENDKSVSALVFKIEHHKTHGKLTYLRLYNGTLKPRDIMHKANNKQQKIAQLKALINGKYTDIEQLNAGDIGIAAGLSDAKVGDIYGLSANIPEPFQLSSALLSVQVKPQDPSQIMSLVHALTQLSDEDPNLDMQWLTALRELHLKITGMIQIEILQSVLQDRFNLSTKISSPSIIYKETPTTTDYGYQRYWMPKPCWAILKLKIEPAELGSGVSYSSQLSVNDVATKYQKEIEHTIDKALQQGIKGWQVTDITITLVEGQDHNVHSRSGDFIIATPMAIMNGLMATGTTLLEPILSFIITAPIDLLGTISSDITKMRGSFESPQIIYENFTLRGQVPASTALQYPIKLASLSAGKAKISTKLYAYQPCTEQQGKSTHYRGVSPLDRDKWILHARGAL